MGQRMNTTYIQKLHEWMKLPRESVEWEGRSHGSDTGRVDRVRGNKSDHDVTGRVS